MSETKGWKPGRVWSVEGDVQMLIMEIKKDNHREYARIVLSGKGASEVNHISREIFVETRTSLGKKMFESNDRADLRAIEDYVALQNTMDEVKEKKKRNKRV